MNARAAVATVAVLSAAVPAVALGARFTGSGSGATFGIQTKGSGTHITKIKHFGWDGLKCGQDRFTGGNSKAIKVKSDGTFSSKQLVGGVQVKLTMRLKGHFYSSGTKAKGTLKITGGCNSGKVKWSAKAG